MDDLAHVLRARDGHRPSREALARRWWGPAYAVALSVTGRAPSAEEAVQEAFLRAFGGIGRLRDPARFGPWLVRITQNAARDLLRGRRPRPLGEEAARIPAREAAEPLAAHDVAAAWRRLPEEERLVTWLRIVDGMPFREIAHLLDRSKSAVDRTFRRALERLRREMVRC